MKLLALGILLLGCAAPGPVATDPHAPVRTSLAVSTDRAAYRPGEPVRITLSSGAPQGSRVRYKHLGRVVADAEVLSRSWEWVPPTADFQGYLTEVYRPLPRGEEILAAVAVDVSSDWTRFPRYGFLSDYGAKEASEIGRVLDNLSRHHINALQFYDWHHKHHRMLPGTAGSPEPLWQNIFGEAVRLSTVEAYIDAAHERNMAAMFYNLIYGVLADADADGVSEDWYLFSDREARTRDRHALSAPFVSDIFLVNPAEPEWQAYLARDVARVFEALDFDGFHMDQLGDRGTLYTRQGEPVHLAGTFEDFIARMQRENPDRLHVLNAVNQYGQTGIARAPTPFLYTEVWPPNESYADLARIIQDNRALSGGRENSVLAAYVNYGLADREGVFNTPSVLFANAVIFAFGGSHLELGEHMLGKEFFPNDNLAMRSDLREALVRYYDFLVAYQNLLRDGGSFNLPRLTTSGQLALRPWPAQPGSVAVVGKEVEHRQVIHLLNFTEAATMSWRDDEGIQPYPREREYVPFTLTTARPVERIWYASPDRNMGASVDLEFADSGGEVAFTLPVLEYWSMVVVEYR